jgi:hypothetical protein
VEKYGSRFSDIQVFAYFFFSFVFSFLGHWKGLKVTNMHNVHNATHL